MQKDYITVFYIDPNTSNIPDFFNIKDIKQFERIVQPILDKSILRFINNPQDIINSSNNSLSNDFLFELFIQRKRNEKMIRESISVQLMDESLYSISFNYNIFLSHTKKDEFEHVIDRTIDIHQLNNLELKTVEYNKWINEIIKYFKISIYEENMNYLMDYDLQKLPVDNKVLAFIAKNLKTRVFAT